MEIPKLNVTIDEKRIKKDIPTIKNEKINNELIEKPSIKEPDFEFKKILDEKAEFFHKFQPNDLFNAIEKEYQKVKDFEFKKLDVKKIKKDVRSM